MVVSWLADLWFSDSVSMSAIQHQMFVWLVNSKLEWIYNGCSVVRHVILHLCGIWKGDCVKAARIASFQGELWTAELPICE
jgi:hypothetical protein